MGAGCGSMSSMRWRRSTALSAALLVSASACGAGVEDPSTGGSAVSHPVTTVAPLSPPMGPPNGSSADDDRGPEAAPTEASSAPAGGSDPAPLLDDFLHVIDEIPRPAGAVLVSVESTARASAFRVDLADVTPKCAVAEPIEAWFAELNWDFFSLGTGESS